jgi:hypothetical protein
MSVGIVDMMEKYIKIVVIVERRVEIVEIIEDI